MDVRFLSGEGIQQHPVGGLEELLARDDGLVWVDIPVCDEEAARLLSEAFGFYLLAVRAGVERNAVPRCAPSATTSSSCCTAPRWARAATSTTRSLMRPVRQRGRFLSYPCCSSIDATSRPPTSSASGSLTLHEPGSRWTSVTTAAFSEACDGAG
jgi:hypothetical protein